MREIIINKNEAGQRFDKLLFKYFNAAPASFVYKMLRKKNITLNNKKSDGKDKLAVGDCVKIFMTDETIDKFRSSKNIEASGKATHKFSLDVVYEDENVIIVNKPAGVLSQKAKKNDIKTYVPMHYVLKVIAGKKKRIQQPLLPNFLFIYATREQSDSFVKKTVDAPISFIKYYLDKTLPPEANGKNPPLIIPYNAMINFIKATSTDSEHVRIVTAEQCHYKSGDKVRVIAGDFKGVVGKVARIAGQQRIVVEISGLCLVATAYIPTDFIEIVK